MQNYYVTCSIVYAVDLLTHRRYVDIIKRVMEQTLANVDGFEIKTCVFESSKIRMIVKARHKPQVQQLIDDFKRISEYELLQAVMEEGKDERRNWMLLLFENAAKVKKQSKEYLVWEREFDLVEWRAGVQS